MCGMSPARLSWWTGQPKRNCVQLNHFKYLLISNPLQRIQCVIDTTPITWSGWHIKVDWQQQDFETKTIRNITPTPHQARTAYCLLQTQLDNRLYYSMTNISLANDSSTFANTTDNSKGVMTFASFKLLPLELRREIWYVPFYSPRFCKELIQLPGL